MVDYSLANKVVLVTGANHGIGEAIARAFAREKARVFVTYFRPPVKYSQAKLDEAIEKGVGGPELYAAMHQQTADSLIEELTNQGVRCHALELDLGKPENIPALFDACEKSLGPVDILVNNHTYCAMETFDPESVVSDGFAISFATAESIDEHHTVNTRAYALMMAEYVKRYVARNGEDGRIINISTDAAHCHVKNINYAASKHAIESYSRSAACELGKYGITVNIIAPGPVQTGYLTAEEVESIEKGTPLGRVGSPEDVADVAAFLASAQARWLTGQLLYVGGGWRMGQ